MIVGVKKDHLKHKIHSFVINRQSVSIGNKLHKYAMNYRASKLKRYAMSYKERKLMTTLRHGIC